MHVNALRVIEAWNCMNVLTIKQHQSNYHAQQSNERSRWRQHQTLHEVIVVIGVIQGMSLGLNLAY